MKRALLLVAIATVPVAAAVLFYAPADKPRVQKPTARAAKHRKVATTRPRHDDVESLRQEVRSLAQRAAEVEEAPAEPDAPPAEAEPGLSFDDELDHNAELERAIQARLDAVIDAESTDTTWAKEREEVLAAYVAASDDLHGVTLSRIECRSTLCRAQIEHQVGPLGEDQLFAALSMPPFNEGHVHASTIDGHAVAYLARSGHQLAH